MSWIAIDSNVNTVSSIEVARSLINLMLFKSISLRYTSTMVELRPEVAPSIRVYIDSVSAVSFLNVIFVKTKLSAFTDSSKNSVNSLSSILRLNANSTGGVVSGI